MHFLVTDREGIECGVRVHSDYVVISIRDPDRPRAKVRKQAGLRGVLYLAFHDTEPVVGLRLPAQIKVMTEDQAREIWAFVRQHHGPVGTVVVHCEQGMSRSPAVAAALCRAMGLDDRHFWQEYQPNQYVYDMVRLAGKGENAAAGASP